jgi:hypothetical protein
MLLKVGIFCVENTWVGIIIWVLVKKVEPSALFDTGCKTTKGNLLVTIKCKCNAFRNNLGLYIILKAQIGIWTCISKNSHLLVLSPLETGIKGLVPNFLFVHSFL